MNNNCKGCFANESTHKNGCTALRIRIDKRCPFYKTSEQYAEDVEKTKVILYEHSPDIYYHYYGKEKQNADRGTDEENYRASEKGQ